MWIRNPFKTLAINTDQMKMVFISKDNRTIKAEMTNYQDKGATYVILGEYKDRETCLLVLDELLEEMKMLCTVYNMPTQEVIDDGYFSSDCQA